MRGRWSTWSTQWRRIAVHRWVWTAGGWHAPWPTRRQWRWSTRCRRLLLRCLRGGRLITQPAQLVPVSVPVPVRTVGRRRRRRRPAWPSALLRRLSRCCLGLGRPLPALLLHACRRRTRTRQIQWHHGHARMSTRRPIQRTSRVHPVTRRWPWGLHVRRRCRIACIRMVRIRRMVERVEHGVRGIGQLQRVQVLRQWQWHLGVSDDGRRCARS